MVAASPWGSESLHFDERRVRARVLEEKIGNRTALHDRLTTARVSWIGRSIAPDLNRWVEVECPASYLEKMAAARGTAEIGVLGGNLGEAGVQRVRLGLDKRLERPVAGPAPSLRPWLWTSATDWQSRLR